MSLHFLALSCLDLGRIFETCSITRGGRAACSARLWGDRTTSEPFRACVATGSYIDASGRSQGLLLAGSGSSWTATQAPVPAGAARSPLMDIYSVACPQRRPAPRPANRHRRRATKPLLLTSSGSAWQLVKAPLPAAARSPLPRRHLLAGLHPGQLRGGRQLPELGRADIRVPGHRAGHRLDLDHRAAAYQDRGRPRHRAPRRDLPGARNLRHGRRLQRLSRAGRRPADRQRLILESRPGAAAT